MKNILLIISLLLTTSSFSQHFNFRNFSIEDGLPQSTIYDIHQDSKGFIWFGTQGGVAKFNGIEFVNYNQKDGLAENHVTAISEDSFGNLWMGHRYEGVSRIQNNKILTILPKELKSTIKSITNWGNGIIAASNSNGLFYFYLNDKGITYSNFVSVDSINLTQLNKVKSKKDELYIGTNNGLIILKDGFVLSKILLNGVAVYDFDWNDKDDLVLTTNNGIKTLSNDEIIQEITLSKTYNSISVSKKGVIWLANNEDGALYIKEGNFQYIDKKNGLSNDDINCIIEDNEGNIWFGLSGTGASQFVAVKFETFDKLQGLQDDQVNSLYMDNLSRLWVSGDKTLDVLEFYDNSNFSLKNIIHVNLLLKEKLGTVYCIFQDSRSLIWLGTDQGIYIINENFKLVTHLTVSDGLSDDFNISITEDKDGYIWSASLYHGVTKIQGEATQFNCQSYDLNSGLCSNSFWVAFVDSKGLVYLGSNDGGISVWDGEKFNSLNESQGLLNPRAGSISEDVNNNIWIGTIGGGIFKYNGEKCVQFSSKDGLSSDNPFLVMADNFGHIWVGTNSGLDVMAIDEVPDTMNRQNLFKHYGVNQGFLGMETNQNAKYKDLKGSLWFGTVKGVVLCNSSEIRNDTTPPQIHLTSKKLFLRDRISLNKKKLNYDENHITFEFIGLHFTNPHQVKYQYFLENFDEEWSPWNKNTTATYSYLPPGKYSFKLKGVNGDNYESNIISHDFEIISPFWSTIWFYLLCVLFAFLLIIIIMRFRTIKIEKAKKFLEKEVKLRTDELNQEKKLVINQKEVIELKNKNITDSINYAKTIQESVLPNTSVLEGYFNSHFIYYNPRDIVSGDFYWFKQNANYIIIAAADCTGHGIPGAFLSMLGSELLNQIVLDPKIHSPAKIIELLDIGIYNAMQKRENKKNYDGIDLSVCVFNKNSKDFQYCGAKRPIVLLSNNKTYVYDPIPGSVGEINQRGYILNDTKISIKKGDRIYMFSDGFQDQFGGEKDKKYLLRRLVDLIVNLSATPLDKQEKIFQTEHLRWKGKNEQVDDILVMGVEI